MPIPIAIDRALTQAESFAQDIVTNREPRALRVGREYANMPTVGAGVVGLAYSFYGLPFSAAALLTGFLTDKQLDTLDRVSKYTALRASITEHDNALNDAALPELAVQQTRAILQQQRELVSTWERNEAAFGQRNRWAAGGAIGMLLSYAPQIMSGAFSRADHKWGTVENLLWVGSASILAWTFSNRDYRHQFKNAVTAALNGEQQNTHVRESALRITQDAAVCRQTASQP